MSSMTGAAPGRTSGISLLPASTTSSPTRSACPLSLWLPGKLAFGSDLPFLTDLDADEPVEAATNGTAAVENARWRRSRWRLRLDD